MRDRRHAAAVPILTALLAAAASGPVSAAGTALWSAGPTTLRSSADGYVVATARGERPLALPAGVEVEELFALRQGAFLSARAPVPPAHGPHRDLFLGWIDDGGWHALPSPEQDDVSATVRENAVPLASPSGDLEAVAWLEGADRQSYEVRFAIWDGLRWSPPATVAPAARGSQLALGAATLADGTKLLVWSRFDGHDDEIVASRWIDGAWSPASPLAADNAVPDVTPTVVAVAGGALAAWSRYDGHDYRVVLSRFDGRSWSVPAWAGPAGSTYPALQRAGRPDRAPAGAAEVWMTYASARIRGWTIVELDSSGRSLRRGRVVDAPTARPALEPQAGGKVRLRWADSESDVDLQ